MRGPRPRWKAPRRPRRQLEQCGELAPAPAAVVAAEERTGLRSGVDRTVNRAHRQREHARCRQRTVDPAAAAVARSPNATLAQTGIDNVGISGIDRETLRPTPV